VFLQIDPSLGEAERPVLSTYVSKSVIAEIVTASESQHRTDQNKTGARNKAQWKGTKVGILLSCSFQIVSLNRWYSR
jgi:hypothetical protein